MTQFYVKDGGSFREVSEFFIRDGTSFTNKTVTNIFVKDSGNWREVFTLFTATSYSSTTGSVTVPALANAIHIQRAVGGGSGGYRGADYDKAGGESAGPGGASGAYLSDVVMRVTGGEQLTINVGSGGSAGTGVYSGNSGAGGNTSISGSVSGALFTLQGGQPASVSGGGVQGPLRSNTASTGGTLTIDASKRLATFSTTDGLTQASTGSSGFTGGQTQSFNDAGAGAAGANPGNCGGDNCTIGGGDGGDSYGSGGNNISGGTGGPNGNTSGTAGTQGSGGGGGGTEPGSSAGGAGGAGEITYRFLRTT